MKWIFALLLSLFLMLQYQLWFGNRGIVSSHRLSQQTDELQAKANAIKGRNDRLMDKIKRLRKNPRLVERYARRDLGMIKKGEVFYRYDKLN